MIELEKRYRNKSLRPDKTEWLRKNARRPTSLHTKKLTKSREIENEPSHTK